MADRFIAILALLVSFCALGVSAFGVWVSWVAIPQNTGNEQFCFSFHPQYSKPDDSPVPLCSFTRMGCNELQNWQQKEQGVTIVSRCRRID
jgi:hypothetical protein